MKFEIDSSEFRRLVFIACFLFPYSVPAEQCQGYETLSNHEGKEIRLKNDVLLFSTDVLKIDIDGSGRSYGIHDQGAENICNGLSPISPKKCQNIVQQGACYTHCQSKFREWHEDGHDPAKIGNYMRSIGLGGSNGSVPIVKLQPAPNDEMFVSHTSLRYGPWKRGDSTDHIESQEAQIEPFEVPFFVIPGQFRRLPWDATPGDIGVALHAQAPSRYVFFIIGDTGGMLDEGSAKLQELLKGEALKPIYKTNALGQNVARFGDLTLSRYSEHEDLDLRIAIFRHTSSYDRQKSGDLLVLQDIRSQAEALEKIESIGKTKLEQFGGPEAVLKCTEGL